MARSADLQVGIDRREAVETAPLHQPSPPTRLGPPASGRHPRRESVADHLTLLSFTAETQGSADLQFDVRIVGPEFEEEATTGLFVFVTDEDPPARAGASIVLARRLEDGEPATFGVNAFTDFFGSFAIDGLEPGTYVVKAHPILFPDAHLGLLGEATLDFPETTLLGPVEVRVGERHGPVTVHVREGA